MFLITSFAQGSSANDRPLTGLRQLLAEMVAAVAERRRQRQTAARVRAELLAYSDRELADLGISRFDIGRLADEAAIAAR